MSTTSTNINIVLEVNSDGEITAETEAEAEQQRDRNMVNHLTSRLRLLRRRVTTARADATNAQKRAQRATIATANARQERDTMQATIDSANAALRDAVLCPICGDVLDNPVSNRECGHTFCLACLTDWHTTAFNNASGATVGTIPPLTPPIQSIQMAGLQRNTMRDIIVTDRGVRRARYDCPYCRHPIVRGPVPNYIAKEVVERVRLANPQSTIEAATSSQRNTNAVTLIKRYFEDADGI